ncbi:MAG: zinc ABC transporter substrate-binding protein, partial [Rhodospirillales bacterium]|nr:zinc ABC transporter substrate-binding protein [Rhodospirillales bacterium]
LNAAGSITVAAERQPGARRLQELRRRIHETNVRCLFREPQVTPKLIGPLTEGGNVKVGVLDPLGAKLADGPELYFRIMEDLATDLAACLG